MYRVFIAGEAERLGYEVGYASVEEEFKTLFKSLVSKVGVLWCTVYILSSLSGGKYSIFVGHVFGFGF